MALQRKCPAEILELAAAKGDFFENQEFWAVTACFSGILELVEVTACFSGILELVEVMACFYLLP